MAPAPPDDLTAANDLVFRSEHGGMSSFGAYSIWRSRDAVFLTRLENVQVRSEPASSGRARTGGPATAAHRPCVRIHGAGSRLSGRGPSGLYAMHVQPWSYRPAPRRFSAWDGRQTGAADDWMSKVVMGLTLGSPWCLWLWFALDLVTDPPQLVAIPSSTVSEMREPAPNSTRWDLGASGLQAAAGARSRPTSPSRYPCIPRVCISLR